MRDGTVLRADVHRPEGDGRYPVILERVAYELEARTARYAEFFASRGYVFVGQNTRGSFWSAGEFTFPGWDDGWGDRKDGYDTIEWCAAQPWSNGRVGTVDGSLSGWTQYVLAPTRPPHLTTMFVRAAFTGYRRGGIPNLGFRRISMMHFYIRVLNHASTPARWRPKLSELEAAVKESDQLVRILPSRPSPWLDEIAPYLAADADHPEYGPHWRARDALTMAHEIDVPVMHLVGWHDPGLPHTLAMFEAVTRKGLTPATRHGQRLLVGPWVHGEMTSDQTVTGEVDHGPEARLGLNECRLRWFDHWLKGEPNGVMDGPPVRVFLMGAGRWLDLPDWPPPDVTYRPVYLRAGSGGDAASLNNGLLSFEPPADEPPDSFDYDPIMPVPTISMSFERGGAPMDHRPIEGRILTYTSGALENDVTVLGPIRMVLYGASNCPDTDWFVRLLDVLPDGRSLNVQRGALRARYRNSFESPELMRTGSIYRFEIDLAATGQLFKRGHRIRVHVTSSEFPPFERNMNTGGINARESNGRVAHNTVFHDLAHPSHVMLPML
jgi:putative CocE/NonD family hydrolase